MTTVNMVKRFWEAHVNNEYYTKQSRGTSVYFDDIARKRYRHHYHLVELFRRLRRYAGQSVLEVGCGIGIDSRELSAAGLRVTGCDLTATALKVAHSRPMNALQPVRYLQASAEMLPFPADSFDHVYSFGVIHHTPDMARAISEMHRVLRPGGRAWVMIYAKHSLVNAIHSVCRLPFESPRSLSDHCPVVVRSTRAEALRLFSVFAEASVHSDYPFTYGMRHISMLLPHRVKRAIGRLIGWHLMIEAVK